MVKREEVEKNEQQVIHQLNEAKVLVMGNTRTIKPLPIKPAKKLSSLLNNILREFNKLGQMDPKERDSTALGGQDELLADSLVDCLVVLSDHYKWGVERDAILEEMTLKEVKSVIDVQAALNEEDDFLLQPLRIISQVLSRTKAAVTDLETAGNPVSMPASESSGGVSQPT